jgi:hypothetical protein
MHEADMHDLARALVARGWWVTAVEGTPSSMLIGFNFLPRRNPCWFKAFEIPFEDCSVEGVEAWINAWMAKVRTRLEWGGSSKVVRLMVAKHGIEAVREVLRQRGRDEHLAA